MSAASRRTLITFLGLTLSAASAWAAPVHLKTEQMVDPLGIDVTHPRFAWQSDAKSDGWMQSAYEVMVASTEKALKNGKGDVWDSGKMDKGDSINIAYGGPALKARTRYFWAVKVWDNKGKQSVSAPAWFEMGLLGPTDWSAKWIRRNDPTADKEYADLRWVWVVGQNAKALAPDTKAQFKYVLHLDKKPERASMHVVAQGIFSAKVNGVTTGAHNSVVTSGAAVWNSFDYEPIMQALKVGDNEIIVDVIAPKPGKGMKTTAAGLAVSIRITDDAGVEKRIVTGPAKWQARSSDGAWKPAIVTDTMAAAVGKDVNGKGRPGPSRVSTDAAALRKDFTVAGKVASARLYVTAMGSYKAYLNGKEVAPQNLLDPGFTDFRKRVLYQTYDVTPMVNKGTNVIAATLAGGWHGSPLTWAGYRDFAGPDMLMAQLEITMSDGSHKTIASDGTWTGAASPIESSEIYGGEIYDARLMAPTWNTQGMSKLSWKPVLVGSIAPGVKVSAQPDLSIHETDTIKPISLSPANAAHPWVYDMGQNMVGNIVLHVRGPRGTTVKMRYAERLDDDGSGKIYTENLRNATVTDYYTLSGNGDETYTPSFTFHGFRYVEISGYPGTPTKDSIEGVVYNSLPDQASIRFKSSSDLLNSMGHLGFWGQKGNFVSIPTDCPQRDERMGWMGDAGVFWRTGTYNYDIASFSHKFMNDIVDAQYENGSYTDIAPNLLGREAGAPGWADAGVLVPYAAWLQYGDTATLERNWASMVKYMNFIETANPNHLRRNKLGNNYADWLAPDPHTPKDLIGTAYWAIVARDMRDMATALGKTADAQKFQAVYDNVAEAYRKEYVMADGSVKGNTQTAYVATVFAGIAPKSLRANMVERLVKDIEAHNNHLTTGFLGTPFLMVVLDDNGRADVAFKLLMQDTYPSWGYMVRKGATTWWERWNGDTGDPSMNSYNHYAFGSVMAWVFRRVAGIDTDEKGAGYHHLTIKPHFSDAVPALHTEYDSAYGTVTTDWDKAKGKFTVVTPPNTTATVTLPNGRTEEMTNGTMVYDVQ